MGFSLKKVDYIPTSRSVFTNKIIDAFIDGEDDIVKIVVDLNDPNLKYKSMKTLYGSFQHNLRARHKHQEIVVYFRSNEVYLEKKPKSKEMP